MNRTDWMPRDRVSVLIMGRNWVSQIREYGKNAWKIGDGDVVALEGAVTDAEEQNSIPAAKRNPGVNEGIRQSFTVLVEVMRDIKRRYFVVPVVSNTDLVNLGLKPKDKVITPVDAPVKSAECNVTYPMSGVIEIKNIVAVGEGGDDRANYGVRIHYGIVGEPTDRDKFRLRKKATVGSDLPHSVFTRRKSYRFDFSEDRGKAVYFCLRIENSKGQVGPWGNVYESYIP